MPDPTFTTPPTAPTRQEPSTFSTRADAFLSWMVTFKGELTTAVSWFSTTASTVSTDATTASDAAIATAADVVAASGFADSASDFADNAASAAGATVWVSAAAYTAGDGVSSPVDFQTYRAKTTHSGVATDPSADATNWQRISISGVYDDLTGKPTLGTAAATDATDYATAAQGSNADTAFGWGNHASAGYSTVTGTETLTNKTLTSPAITSPTITAPAITGTVIEDVYTLTGTTPALEPANGSIKTWTLTANSTPTDSLAAGEGITLMIDDGTAYTITWPTITWINNAAAAPTLAATGYTVVALWKVSTTLYGALVGDGT